MLIVLVPAAKQVAAVLFIVGVAGKALLVKITSSMDEQAPFEIVHLNVALVPAVIPVTPEVGNVGDVIVIVAAPLTFVHVPIPVVAVFPARVKVVVLHLD